MKSTKYIFVTGGVLSSLGKGLTSASIGALLESRGLKITIMKLDPYINVDPGTMNPFQHGEVFVTEDGAETDLDLGHYERYTNVTLGQINNFTSGRIYYQVITKERRGEYLGGTVQVIPHVTDEIKANIKAAAQDVDVAIVEIGGTIGDIESLPFLEAIRQFRGDLGRTNVAYVHLTLIPYIKAAQELKTKPTQHSVKELRSIGIQPDILICRTEHPIPDELKAKISNFCNVDRDAVITAIDVDTIYEVPLRFHKEGLDNKLVELLNIWTRAPQLGQWENLVNRITNPQKGQVNVGIVGKYVNLKESYKSLNEALVHGGIANNVRVNLNYINSEELEKNGTGLLQGLDALLVPGGFGNRGIEGKMITIQYARENKIPFFGICLGMQLAVVEFSRNVAQISGAASEEFTDKTNDPVIYLMTEWYDHKNKTIINRDRTSNKGGTMRLGAYPCILKKDSTAYGAYNVTEISERHRHRYEFNNQYRSILESYDLIFTGTSPDDKLVEIVEFKNHPWFLGCQFHPEFKSSPLSPHPLFISFIKAGLEYNKKMQGKKK